MSETARTRGATGADRERRGRAYVLDSHAWRSRDGSVLVGGTPGRLVRLSAAGAAALDRLLAPDADPAPAPAVDALAARLTAAGLLHPVGRGADVALTTVIPVRDGGPALAELVAALTGQGEVIVVDDGSRDGSPAAAGAVGARVIANAGAAGPAGARNSGLAAARTELVAFLDADCRAAPGWAAPLAGLLVADPGLALAAPRVRSAPGEGRVARYETARSPLDMGGDPARIGPGRRVAYVPSAALVARREALESVAGFDERLTVGEDVDLVLRLIDAGWTARYAPEAEVLHRPRTDWRALARQRYGYGTSAAPLQRRHPGATAPLRANPHTATAWLAGAALGWRGAAGATALSALRAAAAGDRTEVRLALAGAAARGHLHATGQLARAATREWLPLTLAACAVSRRARRCATGALAVALLGDRRPGARPLDPLSYAALTVVDRTAYCAGLWRGAVGERSLAALAPAPQAKAPVGFSPSISSSARLRSRPPV